MMSSGGRFASNRSKNQSSTMSWRRRTSGSPSSPLAEAGFERLAGRHPAAVNGERHGLPRGEDRERVPDEGEAREGLDQPGEEGREECVVLDEEPEAGRTRAFGFRSRPGRPGAGGVPRRSGVKRSGCRRGGPRTGRWGRGPWRQPAPVSPRRSPGRGRRHSRGRPCPRTPGSGWARRGPPCPEAPPRGGSRARCRSGGTPQRSQVRAMGGARPKGAASVEDDILLDLHFRHVSTRCRTRLSFRSGASRERGLPARECRGTPNVRAGKDARAPRRQTLRDRPGAQTELCT